MQRILHSSIIFLLGALAVLAGQSVAGGPVPGEVSKAGGDGFVLAQAGHHGWGPGHGRGRGMGIRNYLGDLDLDPDQQGAARDFWAGVRGCAQRGTYAFTHTELIQWTLAPEADKGSVSALLDQRLEQHRATSYCMLEQAMTFREALHPEQRATLLEKLEASQAQRQRWMRSWQEE